MRCHRLIPNIHLHPATGEAVEVGYECVDCDLEDDGQWVQAQSGEYVYVTLDAVPTQVYRTRWEM